MSDIIEILDESTIEIIEIIDESGETILVVIEDSKEQNVGVFATLVALQTAYPTGQNGWTATVRPNQSASWVDTAWVITSGEGGGGEVFTTAEKNKLSDIATGATANSSDAHLLNRANHTGTQAESTITDKLEFAVISLSDNTTDLETKAGAETYENKIAGTITGVSSDVITGPVSSPIIVNIKVNGVSILSTDIYIDSGTTRSIDAAIQAVISNGVIAVGDIISFDIIQIGSATAGAGLKAGLIITR